MNDVDITAQCVNKTNTKVMIDIPYVTGDIIIRAYSIVMYTITKNIDNCSITNTNDSIAHGSSYYAQIAANLDYVIVNATLTMGGENVNNMYMSNTETGGLEIDIPNVTGNIVITVETEEIPPEEYQISYYLVGGVASDDRLTVYHGDSYYTEITVTDSTLLVQNYQLIMDETDVTNQYMTASDKKVIVNIPYITGHINIRVEAYEEFISIPCQYITVSPTSATLSVGQSIPITGTAYPSDTTDYMMVYSSDVSIISIGSGSAGNETTKTVTPTAQSIGTASIIFDCNGVTGSCSITVK